MMRYLYFPRLRNEGVYQSVFRVCSSVPDYFATAQEKNGCEFLGLQTGKEIFQLDDELLIVPLETAKEQFEKQQAAAVDIGRIRRPAGPESAVVPDGHGKTEEGMPATVPPFASVQQICMQYNITEDDAVTSLYTSKLYTDLEREQTKLWHLSPFRLADL
jgi:hypothetical protein